MNRLTFPWFYLSLLASSCAVASTFNIAPIRAELSAAHRTEALTLVNAEEEPCVVQIHVVAWSQHDGEERLDETRELLVSPPVLQLAAKGEQIVRVALRREPDPARELTYRVIFEEVPQVAAVNFTGLRVALRLSVPVFVAPTQGGTSAQISWEAHSLPDGALEVAATNHGSGHLQVSDLEVQVPGGGAPVRGLATKYVLPGSRMAWRLASGEAVSGGAATSASVAPSSWVVRGRSEQGEFSADVAPSGL